MKGGIIFSIVFSLILVGGSLWYRYGVVKYSGGGELIAANPQYNATELAEFTNLTPATTTEITSATGEVLNNSEAIGRSLIADYINLTASGQTSDKEIKAISEKYVNLIPSLNKATVLSMTDLKIVADTKANFQNYGNQMTLAHQSYAQAISQMTQSSYTFSETSSDMYTVMSSFNKEYAALADKLKAIPVPKAVATDHLALLNLYLASASATSAITPTQTDSALFFSGLLIFKQNVDKQEFLLNRISQTLTAHGI